MLWNRYFQTIYWRLAHLSDLLFLFFYFIYFLRNEQVHFFFGYCVLPDLFCVTMHFRRQMTLMRCVNRLPIVPWITNIRIHIRYQFIWTEDSYEFTAWNVSPIHLVHVRCCCDDSTAPLKNWRKKKKIFPAQQLSRSYCFRFNWKIHRTRETNETNFFPWKRATTPSLNAFCARSTITISDKSNPNSNAIQLKR